MRGGCVTVNENVDLFLEKSDFCVTVHTKAYEVCIIPLKMFSYLIFFSIFWLIKFHWLLILLWVVVSVIKVVVKGYRCHLNVMLVHLI